MQKTVLFAEKALRKISIFGHSQIISPYHANLIITHILCQNYINFLLKEKNICFQSLTIFLKQTADGFIAWEI